MLCFPVPGFPSLARSLPEGPALSLAGLAALQRLCSIRMVAAVGCGAGSAGLRAAGGGLMQGRYLSCASSITGLRSYVERCMQSDRKPSEGELPYLA